jgi:hypothetical protein
MKPLGFASLPWGKPCFPHEPPTYKGIVRAARVGADDAGLLE